MKDCPIKLCLGRPAEAPGPLSRVTDPSNDECSWIKYDDHGFTEKSLALIKQGGSWYWMQRIVEEEGGVSVYVYSGPIDLDEVRMAMDSYLSYVEILLFCDSMVLNRPLMAALVTEDNGIQAFTSISGATTIAQLRTKLRRDFMDSLRVLGIDLLAAD